MKETKGFFPYEYLNDYETLEDQKLPSIDNFFSNLKYCNVLEQEYLQYQKLLSSGKAEYEVLNIMSLERRPNTKEENYKFCENIWKEEEMASMKDYLMWYNN